MFLKLYVYILQIIRNEMLAVSFIVTKIRKSDEIGVGTATLETTKQCPEILKKWFSNKWSNIPCSLKDSMLLRCQFVPKWPIESMQ